MNKSCVAVCILWAGLVVAGTAFSNDVSSLNLELHLDFDRLIVGEPLSGEILLSNVSADTVCIENLGERPLYNLSFKFRAPSGTFWTSANRLEEYGGDIVYSRYVRRTMLPPGSVIREPVFLLTRFQPTKQFGGLRATMFVLSEPGTYSVVVQVSVRGLDGSQQLLAVSDPIAFSVSKAGVGFDAYEASINGWHTKIARPFFAIRPEWFDAAHGKTDVGSYGRAYQTIVAYQAGIRLKKQLLLNIADEHRSNDQIVEAICSGLVGDLGLAIRKWRLALLGELGRLGKYQSEASGFDRSEFISSLPNRQVLCGTSGEQ